MYNRVIAIAEHLRGIIHQAGLSPKVGIVLGTGLGNLVTQITDRTDIPYTTIPDFPLSTVEGHAGQLIVGKLGGVAVLAMQGRFHFYEGYDMKTVTLPIRVMHELGIETLLLSNASGGINPDYEIGELMIINDHINFFPEHPLRGRNEDRWGERFPDMHEVYSRELIERAEAIAAENDIRVKKGVYVGTQGPTFETPAEYVMFRAFGADAVGMSTVPEAIVAHHMGMRVFGISIITDLGVPGKIVEVSHEEVQEIGNLQQPKMTLIMTKLVQSL